MPRAVTTAKATQESPASTAGDIVPLDGVPLEALPRGVYIGGDGDLNCQLEGGNSVTFVGLKAGTILPIRPVIVNSTGTTASQLVGLY
jgi:hypothetical protein